MSDEPRFVFDAKFIISAALFAGSTPDRALRFALRLGRILLSEVAILELQDLFARPKFDRYLTLAEREMFLGHLIEQSEVVEIIKSVHASRDSSDDKYLSLAAAGNATCIVSGDADLLVLKSFGGIPILNPAEFLAWLQIE